jgi:hypothetical protein
VAYELALFAGALIPFASLASPYMENIIASRQLQVERKHLTVDLYANPRGGFRRNCEESIGRRSCGIAPSAGVAEFINLPNATVPADDAKPILAA